MNESGYSKIYDDHYCYFQQLLRKNNLEKSPPNKFSKQLFRGTQQYESLLRITPGIILLIDFSCNNYVYHSDNVTQQLDLDIDEMYQHGTAYTFSLFQKEHYDIMFSNIFPNIYRLFGEFIQKGESHKLRITYCNKMRTRSGEYRWFMHHLSILSSHKDEPVIGLKYMVDFNDFKKDNTLEFIAYSKNDDGTESIILKQSINLAKQLLSQREQEIISLLTQGKTSKQIAYELGISEHTVNNHRRNMLHKTATSNVTELISLVYN